MVRFRISSDRVAILGYGMKLRESYTSSENTSTEFLMQSCASFLRSSSGNTLPVGLWLSNLSRTHTFIHYTYGLFSICFESRVRIKSHITYQGWMCSRLPSFLNSWRFRWPQNPSSIQVCPDRLDPLRTLALVEQIVERHLLA